MRIACGVEYLGTDFCGWQTQAGVRTVQAWVEEAIAKVADHPVRVHCAGRTDTGVHALGQVIHFDSPATRTMRSWVLGSNVHLPRDVALLWAQPVDETFHARFSATARHYRYVILNRAVRPAILDQRVTWFHRPLEVERMQAAAAYLVGEHDFSSYRALSCQAKSPVRTLYQLDVNRCTDEVRIALVANGFLHHMVRNIAGVLMSIGAGDRKPAWAGEVLAVRDRRLGGVTAAPGGLYLMKVDYPQGYGLP